ncbi:probable E3 ubiquitin-protein ligase RNF217 [Gambusia affinis]|uniref:probable E3 ubiquitin-protein ligase RNF217 n=1 Tax=Gambusia affinis TaxID=33528 RepID=UPI001CDCDB45|nr:probable E3 ubiquitin-protein ligase RNF217 [Gambusia affinis]
MGRAKSGMEDDEPIADACEMPSFISNFEEGRGKLSRNQPTGTSITDGEVEMPVGGLNRSVIRSNSRLSLDGGDGRTWKRRGEGERDAEGNNNNNCNSGGVGAAGRRRRASAVEVLRRNFGDTKSPSRCFSAKSRMQSGVEHGAGGESGNNDCKDVDGAECVECPKSDVETGGAGDKNELPSNELTTSDVTGVKYLKVRDKCHPKTEDDNNTVSLNESFSAKEHVYCTVYCVANDTHRTDAEITDRYDDAVTSDETETDLETVKVGDQGTEPVLYTLDDLVDPFGNISHRLDGVQAGAESQIEDCRVCLEEKPIASLPCCGKALCEECLKIYVSSLVKEGNVVISCPIMECTGTLEEGLIISHLSREGVLKYRYFLQLSHLDSSTKPCPQCSHFTSLKESSTNRNDHKYKIQCISCQFVWCFKCHAPWHDGIKCRDYIQGDKLLRTWASVIEHGQRNAQKCPRCKIHIQRTEGCDHMACSQCGTNFCYRCGERYRSLRFFGDHNSNLSVFGCKYRFFPDRPHVRRLLRGSVFAAKSLLAPLVFVLMIVVGALALVIGLFVFPVYYFCKKRKKEQEQQTRGSGRWI